jgi:succinyl-CoA synthetase beta subunit
MNLLEHEAKQLLKHSGIPVPISSLIKDQTNPITLPTVLKSQVPVGGRGKLGGVIVVKTKEESVTRIDELLKLSIKGHTPTALLAEELLSIRQEYYLSLAIDRDTASIRLLAHKNGGVEIESHDQSSFFSRYDFDQFNQLGDELADYYDIADKAFILGELLKNLYRCLIDNDAMLIEINPLILTTDGNLIAGDAKITFDDAALFRHPEWKSYEQQPQNVNFVTLDQNGNVATIANGAGLAMATVDAVKEAGLSPANFLDIGGGANEASVLAAFTTISTQPSVKAIVINIFAGITRCDEVAKAIISAKEQIEHLPPLFIRLTGTNAEVANTLLKDHSIPQFSSLKACIDGVQNEVVS